MNLPEFNLMLRILGNMDRHEFGDLFPTKDLWMEFRDAPANWFIFNRGDHAEKVWAIAIAKYEDQSEAWLNRGIYA